MKDITPEELQEILAEHKKWLESEGKDGKQADLSRTNLRGADLPGVNLEKANLWGADLREANLTGAKLKGANLQGANLTEANLRGADLQGAKLQKANLQEANLWKANLTGVRNFEKVKNFKGARLINVKGLSKKQLEFAKSKGAVIEEPKH